MILWPGKLTAVLALDADSKPAFQTLLFLLLHTDDYSAALDLVLSRPAGELKFEHAYCLYRLQREREALPLLADLPEEPRVAHLRAQLAYRLGEYEEAEQLYAGLLQGASPSEAEDIRTNVAATQTQTRFIESEYRQKLSTPAVVNDPAVTNKPADVARDVPALPAGWAKQGTAAEAKQTPPQAHAQPEASSSADAGRTAEKKKERTKPRHPLPKGVSLGDTRKEDPERWTPLRQRSSYVPKKGKKETTGLGTQGGFEKPASSNNNNKSGGGGGGGGGKNKKKGKKK